MNDSLHRRSTKRFSVNVNAFLVTKEGTEKRVLLKNLSSGGASIVMDRFPNESERVKLIINAPAILDKPVTRDAEIMWCKKINNNSWELGLTFGIDRIIIPHYSFSKEEGKKKSPAKSSRLILWVSAFFVMAIILGSVLFIFKGKLQIYFFPQKATVSPIRTPLQASSRSRTLTLRGITFDPLGRSFALINNKAVAVGESIEAGIEVKKINQDSVEIEIGGKNQILALNKSIVVQQE